MSNTENNKHIPNSLRFFITQGLHSFSPWYLMEDYSEFEATSSVFHKEDINEREVFTFASRIDNDDFAGLEIIDGKIQENVICYHPTFRQGDYKNNWDIVCGEYKNILEFMSETVIPDMQEMSRLEDADEL